MTRRPKLLNCFLALIVVPGSLYSQASSLLDRIDSLHQAGEYELASSAIGEVLNDSSHRQKAEPWVLKGKIYHKLAKTTPIKKFDKKIDDLKTAYSAYTRALEIDSASAATDEALFNVLNIEDQIYKLAMNQVQQENYPGGYKAFTFLVASRQESPALSRQEIEPGILYQLAHTASATGRFDEAKNVFQQLKKENFHQPKLYQGLAEVYKNKEKYARAVSVLNEGWQHHPQNLELLFDQTSILLDRNQYKQAAGKIERAIDTLENPNADLQFRLGVVYDEMDEYRQAAEHYQRATEMQPDYYKAHYNCGVMFYNRAIEMNKKLQELEAFDSTYSATMEKRDRYLNKARPHFRQATELKPDQNKLENILSDINQTID